MVGRYPLSVVFLEIAPEDADVNVHPTKAEVRFKSQDKIFSFVQRSARKALLAYTPVHSVSTQLWGNHTPTEFPSRQVGIDWSIAHDENLPMDDGEQVIQRTESGEQAVS